MKVLTMSKLEVPTNLTKLELLVTLLSQEIYWATTRAIDQTFVSTDSLIFAVFDFDRHATHFGHKPNW